MTSQITIQPGSKILFKDNLFFPLLDPTNTVTNITIEDLNMCYSFEDEERILNNFFK